MILCKYKNTGYDVIDKKTNELYGWGLYNALIQQKTVDYVGPYS